MKSSLDRITSPVLAFPHPWEMDSIASVVSALSDLYLLAVSYSSVPNNFVLAPECQDILRVVLKCRSVHAYVHTWYISNHNTHAQVIEAENFHSRYVVAV